MSALELAEFVGYFMLGLLIIYGIDEFRKK